MVAKALPAGARRAAVTKKVAEKKKKEGGKKAKPALPAAVTMRAAEIVRGDQEGRGEWGVLYRLVVEDANGRPIGGGVYTIRKHVLPVKRSGSFGTGSGGAQISVVRLEEDGTGVDFVGVAEARIEEEAGATETVGAVAAPKRLGATAAKKGATAAAKKVGKSAVEGEEESFEYFSFELGGVTYAIPRSGFALTKKRRAGRLDVARAPLGGGSVHGAVVAGLVEDGGGDVYSFHLE